MREGHEFVGKYTEQEIEPAKNFLRKGEILASEKIDGEFEKTAEELAMIELGNNLLGEYLNKMGIDYNQLELSHIHILDPATMEKLHPGLAGTSEGSMRQIYLERSEDNRVKFFQLLLHELVHYASKIKMYANIETETIRQYRSGYLAGNKSGKLEYKFEDLNEAVTELIAYQIYYDNQEKIDQLLNIEDSTDNIRMSYINKVKFFETLVKEIAKLRNETEKESWQRIAKAYFTGEMMHLRDIEKILGKGGLRDYAEGDI